MTDEPETSQSEEMQLVIFDLAGEAYGVVIQAVLEIIRMQEITTIPQAPYFVKGVINLRGKVIPVADLRKRFSMPAAEESKESRIVVVDIGGQAIGMTVDAVTEVTRIPAGTVEPPSSVITTSDSDYLMGIAKLDSGMIILLDLTRVLAEVEPAVVEEPVATAAA